MALIIKADMPTKGCADCPLKRYWEGNPWTYGYACFITSRDIDKEIKEGVFHESCPIIGEIPDSHGDLIDEDEFRQVIYREIRNHKKDEPITMILKGILWEMDNAPVIVEATE